MFNLWRSKQVNSKEFDELRDLIMKLETKVKELSHATTMLEIDLHNTRDKIMKKIKPKDLIIDDKAVEEKKEGIFLRPDGLPIN